MVKVCEAKAVGSVDEDGVGVGDVDSALDALALPHIRRQGKLETG
ncbi:hypothetical protein N8624_00740 [bacterium]|nr:hypothetical protein [bacterium]